MTSAGRVTFAAVLGCAVLCQGLWNTEPDRTVTFYVYWSFPADKYEDFKNGTADFVALTKQEAGNKFYGFTLRETTAVCKEGYQSGQAFLDHLTNVDTPLKKALAFAEISKIEVHGPESEFDVLKTPLAGFSVTYFPLVPSSFYVPANWKTAADTTVTMLVYWAFTEGNYSAFEAGTADFVTLTKQEPDNVFYGFTLRETSAVCKEAYVNAQAFLDHLTNVDAPLQAALQISSIAKIEAHGPTEELDKLRGPLASFSTTYWALEPGAFYMPCNYDSTSEATTNDNTVAFMVHWAFAADMHDAFKAGTADFVSLTKTEAGCLYYGFTLQSTTAVCKEGYKSAQDFLDHLGNVDAPLQRALNFSQITKIEVHGPAAELEKLKEPLATFDTSYWALHPSSYYVAHKYLPPLDTTVAVMVHWEFSAANRDAFDRGTAEFTKLTKMEPENVYYGFTMRNTSAVCKEGYKTAQGFLDHLTNVDAPLQDALAISSISKIEVHGPAEELEKLKEPLASFSVTYWPLEPGAFTKDIACDTPIFYSAEMKKSDCGSLKDSYRAENCCGAPAKTATSLKMTCAAAKAQYQLEGCCGSPSKEIMLFT